MSADAKAGTLKFGPLGPDTAHACIDMQRLFGEKTQWFTPDLPGIVANTTRLIERAPARTIFTRFRTPDTVEEAPGHWRPYYERYSEVLASKMPDDMFGVLKEFRRFVPPGVEVDKLTYNAFENPEFGRTLERWGTRTLVFSGVETDVCVLGTLMGAVDRGYRAIVASDAVASGNPKAHKASIDIVFPRYEMQIEVADTETILANWKS